MRVLVRWAVLTIALLTGARVSVALAEPSTLLRFYYSAATSGQIDYSPADPTGASAGQAVNESAQTDLELIFFRRVGLSATRQWGRRTTLTGSAQTVQEDWEQNLYNLSLYLRKAGHNRLNMYLGGGTGTVPAYRWSVDGVRQDDPPQHHNMPVTRTFGGFDYTFERVGFRLEFSQVDVDKKTELVSDRMRQTYRQFIVFIPFN